MIARAAALGAGIAAAAATPASASPPPAAEVAALALPGPNAFVSGLDLECFDTPGPALNVGLTLSHLNPVLVQLGLPAHQVTVRELQQTCVPVSKNGVLPAAGALPFIRHVDLACYRVDSAPLPVATNLALRHLNPVLSNLPGHGVTLIQPAQLCVPVGKNGVALPPDEQRLAQFIDLECYRVDASAHPGFGVNLRQLNPQLTNAILGHNMTLGPQPRQMCVPVRKNGQAIPLDILAIVQWIDLEKFAASPLVAVAPVTVVLNHLNPLFATLPKVQVVLERAIGLMVPVAKNGVVPPP